MNWHSYLQSRTRSPEVLWRMVLWILAAGVGLGYVAEKVYQPRQAGEDAVEIEVTDRSPTKPSSDELAAAGRWGQLWWALPDRLYRYDRLSTVGLAAFTGSCWLVFMWQAMQSPKLGSRTFWAMLLALPLGVLSIWPTVFLDYWLEYRWNLAESAELVPGLRYFVLSVGAREELAKLVCVLPLMPLLLSIRSELAALLVSGCVGLGFAMEENVGYFTGSGGTDSVGRFLTANPLHITMTGLAGLMLYRVFRNPQGWGPHALGVLGMLVIAHGVYDAFIVLPTLNDYSLFGTIAFALVVYQFFRELRDLRTKKGDAVSLTANFLCGVSLVVAVTFVYLSATVGLSIAFESLVGSVLGLAVMVYLFLREMPETMVTV